MYDMTSIDATLKYLEKVRLEEVCHFYWPRAYVTLCGKDKRYQKPMWVAEIPFCHECAARMVEAVLKARASVAA
jgi:hypothetical protein